MPFFFFIGSNWVGDSGKLGAGCLEFTRGSGCLSSAGGFVRALLVSTLRGLEFSDSPFVSFSEDARQKLQAGGTFRAGKAVSSE